MIWLFQRDHEVTRVETHFDSATKTYILTIAWAKGIESTERFTDTAEFEARVLALERELAESRWVQQGGPRFHPDTWRL